MTGWTHLSVGGLWLGMLKLNWCAKFTANSFPLFIKQYFVKLLGKFQKFLDWELRQEQCVSVNVVSGDRFQQSCGLGWARRRGMSTAVSQTTESHCVTQYNQKSGISSQMTWISTLLGDILDRNGIHASCLPIQKRVAVAKLTEGWYNDKLNRVMQSLPQPRVLRPSQTLLTCHSYLSITNNQHSSALSRKM